MDSAMHYLQMALALDKDDWIIYYDIAGISLLKNDSAIFFEYFEKSLEKGADVEMIRKDPDLKNMMNHKKVKELLEQFDD